MFNRQAFHERETRKFVKRLQELGLTGIERKEGKGFDLLVGEVRIGLRFSHVAQKPHTVTVGGKRYTYHEYKSCHFNFHRHGRIEYDSDVVICVDLATQDFFCIPRDKISGPTFTLHKGQRPYNGKYLPFKNNVSALQEMIRERRKLRTHKRSRTAA